MPKLIQINITANWGSHGKIAEDIGKCVLAHGWESYIAYGRWANPSESQLIRIGNLWDERAHAFQSRLLDNHGLASKHATRKLIDAIKKISPDIIHLHNIHGYYLNYPLLFDFLAQYGKPVVWTLHDCWPLTGHCAYFTFDKCEKWKKGCFACMNKTEYPKRYLFDRSERNYSYKKRHFTSVPRMTLVPVSDWLNNIVGESFLKYLKHKTIHNGIDLEVFKPSETYKDMFPGNKVVLGVSSVWDRRKGMEDFLKLRGLLDSAYTIVLIGLNEKQIKLLPEGVVGIKRTNNVQELVAYYSRADVFVNSTYEDNFPTTNIEALACGTPVITYNTGGSPEAIDKQTGEVIPVGDVELLANRVNNMCNDYNYADLSKRCRARAEKLFNKNDRYKEYYYLYQQVLESK